MRKMKKPPAEELRRRKEEPLAEGLQVEVPTDSRGRRLWSKLTDEQVVDHAKKVMKKDGLNGKKELATNYSGLYLVLRKRELLDEVGFEEKIKKSRPWKDMSDDEIVEYAKKFMGEKGISGREELQKTDVGLYFILRRRKLVEEIGFETKIRKRRSWKDMSDDEIVGYAKRVMEKKGIAGKKDLSTADGGLYAVLRKRGLLEDVGFKKKIKKGRSWISMNNDKIVEFARRVMNEKKISGRGELEKADLGLYNILRKRGLLDEVGFEEKIRFWKDVSDEEIIELTKKVILEKGISRRHELEKADRGLYNILKKRGLLEDVGFDEKRGELRSWKDMDDEEIVEFARKRMEEKEITRRIDLDKADGGLYGILKRRKLVDRAFAHIDQQQKDTARDAVIDALEAFAANDNDSAEDDVA